MDTVQAILGSALAFILVILLITRVRYQKVIREDSLVVGNIYAKYRVIETGYGVRFLGFGKLYELSIDLPLHAPEFYIDGYKKEKTLFDAPLYFNQDQKLTLEGDFSDFFDVYIPANKQIEALQILTPEIMVYMRDNLTRFDVHIIDKHLTIRSAKTKDNGAVLVQAAELFTARLYKMFHSNARVDGSLVAVDTLKKDTTTQSFRIFGRRYKARLVAAVVISVPVEATFIAGIVVTGKLNASVILTFIVCNIVLVALYKSDYLS